MASSKEERDALEHARATGEIFWGMPIQPEDRLNPVRAAYDAAERGDQIFQTEISLSLTQGKAYRGGVATRVSRVEDEANRVVNEIEKYGWHLEHVSTTFVPTGATSTGRVGMSGDESAFHGFTNVLYVFRRPKKIENQ